jgi:two-component system chemotaxis response regulator CheB
VVAIGVSTGGPPAVQKILTAMPAGFRAPILIAQHMPASFTGPFAQRLNGQSHLTVKEAENGETLRNATAYVCPGGKHIRLEKQRSGLLGVSISEEPRDALYKPSASALMESIGLTLGRRGLGVILTGMGNDGMAGTRVLKEKGGWAIAQSEATCVVYGMPKAIVEEGLADEIVDIDDMAAAITKFFAK